MDPTIAPAIPFHQQMVTRHVDDTVVVVVETTHLPSGRRVSGGWLDESEAGKVYVYDRIYKKESVGIFHT